MLGKKQFKPKMHYYISLDKLVPQDDFYRKVENILDLGFTRLLCKNLYGKTGNKSIDPVVFFKIEFYGYLEGITSDRALAKRIQDCLSVRLFLYYDLDEETPCHSTISRTRRLIPKDVYEKVFDYMLSLCVKAGLVLGKHQSIDSTLVEANASIDSMERKRPQLTVVEHYEKAMAENTDETKIKDETQLSVTDIEKNKNAADDECKLKIIRNDKAVEKPKKNNKEFESTTDADAKLAKKPGFKLDMYYSTTFSVDSKAAIITSVSLDTADTNDTKILLPVVDKASEKLSRYGLVIESVGADKGYCSGRNLKGLEVDRKIEPFIPTQRHNRIGFIENKEFKYNSLRDVYTCPSGKELRELSCLLLTS